MKHLKGKISKTLVVYIVIFSSIVTLFLTSIQLYIDYKDGIKILHERIEQIKLTNIESLTQSLWTIDHTSIKSQLNGLIRINDIIYVEVIDENKKLVAKVGEIDSKNTITETLQLKQMYRATETNIGQLTVIATKINLYNNLINTVVIILVSQAIKTFLVSIFILIIFYSLITRHINKIAQHAENINLNSRTKPLQLDRGNYNL